MHCRDTPQATPDPHLQGFQWKLGILSRPGLWWVERGAETKKPRGGGVGARGQTGT